MGQSNSFNFAIEKKKNYNVVTLSYSPKNSTEKPLIASIAPELGSNLFSLTWDKLPIIISDKRLLEKCGFTGCFVLFPTPNRVKNSTFIFQKKSYVLKRRGEIVPIHGLVFTEPWTFTKPIVTNRGVSFKTSISITKTSPLLEAFPFPCILTLEYNLYAKGIKITYTVKNTGSSKLPFGFALHPYFNRLSGSDKTLISVPATSWMESSPESLLPSGKLISVAGKPFNIQKPTPLEKLNLDHVYTDMNPNHFATIDYQAQHIKVNLKTSPDFTHAVVYTGEPSAVCIENQTCSTDAHNLYARGLKKESHLLIIKPKQSHSGFIQYEILPY